jgi:hypothetical protein
MIGAPPNTDWLNAARPRSFAAEQIHLRDWVGPGGSADPDGLCIAAAAPVSQVALVA